MTGIETANLLSDLGQIQVARVHEKQRLFHLLLSDNGNED